MNQGVHVGGSDKANPHSLKIRQWVMCALNVKQTTHSMYMNYRLYVQTSMETTSILRTEISLLQLQECCRKTAGAQRQTWFKPFKPPMSLPSKGNLSNACT